MKKSLTGLWLGIAGLLSAAIYSMIVFWLKGSLDVSEWILYGFTLMAFILFFVHMATSARQHDRIVLDKILGTLTSFYFGVQFVCGGVICMCFHDLPVTPVWLSESIFLALYFILALILQGVQNQNATQSDIEQNAVRKMRLLESDILTMAQSQTDSQRRQALETLAEEIHFCNVAASQNLSDIEANIAKHVALLQTELHDDTIDIFPRIEQIRCLMQERERISLLSR